MLPAVHEDLPVAVDVGFEEEEDVRRRLHDAPRIGRDARHAGRQAVRLRIVLRLPRLQILRADGSSGIVSPFGSPCEMSLIGPPPCHRPAKSG